MVQKPIRVKSNLVLVPVFVLNKRSIDQLTETEEDCLQRQDKLFEGTPPTQAFALKDCEGTDVRGLEATDFALFQDRVRETIQRVTVEHWGMPARDNKTKHAETSFTPSAIWSSTDLGGSSADFQWSFYNLAYVPARSGPGCHAIDVKVNRPGTVVFARNSYCAGQTVSDPLYGTNYDKRLESDLAPSKKPKLPLQVQAGIVYVRTNTARVDIRLGFPWTRLNHQWNLDTWMLWARVSVLGIVYRNHGTMMARFSDLIYPSYWPTYVLGRLSTAPPSLVALHPRIENDMTNMLTRKDPWWLPARYETQLDLPPGQYSLKVVLSDGEKFGRVEMPLDINAYDGKELALSSVMLCKRYRPAQVAAEEYAAANFAPQYVPLVSGGLRFTPTADTSFQKGDPMIAYFEVYAPMTAGQPAGPVVAQARVVAAKNDTVLKVFPAVHVAEKAQARGSFWAIPVALKIPYEQFPKGAYRLEVHATDAAGQTAPWRTANFAVQ